MAVMAIEAEVLGAEQAKRVTRRFGDEKLSDIGIFLFGLGEIDGDLEVAPLLELRVEEDVLVDLRLADIVVGDGEGIEVFGRFLRVGLVEPVEDVLDRGGTR